MAHSDNNTYPTPSTSGELEGYQFSNETSTTEETNVQTPDAFVDNWGVDGQSSHTANPSRGLRAEASLESVTSVTQQEAQTHGHGELSFPRYYWPLVGGYDQSHHSSTWSRDNSFASTAASESPTVVSAPSSVPLDYLGDNQNVPSTSASHANVQTPHQHRTGSTSTRRMRTRRFEPYVKPNARSNEHTNAEAGPSTLTPLLVPYVAPPVTHPSGGSSEATADAENNSTTVTEEEAAPTTRRPRGTGRPRGWRDRHGLEMDRLCVWAQGWRRLRSPPTQVEALSIALEAIKQNRDPVYDEPRLDKAEGKRTAEGNAAADAEHKRRTNIRKLNEELSRFYKMVPDQVVWGCPELLLKVLSEVESLEKPPVKPST